MKRETENTNGPDDFEVVSDTSHARLHMRLLFAGVFWCVAFVSVAAVVRHAFAWRGVAALPAFAAMRPTCRPALPVGAWSADSQLALFFEDDPRSTAVALSSAVGGVDIDTTDYVRVGVVTLIVTAAVCAACVAASAAEPLFRMFAADADLDHESRLKLRIMQLEVENRSLAHKNADLKVLNDQLQHLLIQTPVVPQ